MFGFAVGGKFLFELRDLVAQNERHVTAYAIQSLANLVAQTGVLHFQVKVRNLHAGRIVGAASLPRKQCLKPRCDSNQLEIPLVKCLWDQV